MSSSSSPSSSSSAASTSSTAAAAPSAAAPILSATEWPALLHGHAPAPAAVTQPMVQPWLRVARAPPPMQRRVPSSSTPPGYEGWETAPDPTSSTSKSSAVGHIDSTPAPLMPVISSSPSSSVTASTPLRSDLSPSLTSTLSAALVVSTPVSTSLVQAQVSASSTSSAAPSTPATATSVQTSSEAVPSPSLSSTFAGISTTFASSQVSFSSSSTASDAPSAAAPILFATEWPALTASTPLLSDRSRTSPTSSPSISTTFSGIATNFASSQVSSPRATTTLPASSNSAPPAASAPGSESGVEPTGYALPSQQAFRGYDFGYTVQQLAEDLRRQAAMALALPVGQRAQLPHLEDMSEHGGFPEDVLRQAIDARPVLSEFQFQGYAPRRPVPLVDAQFQFQGYAPRRPVLFADMQFQFQRGHGVFQGYPPGRPGLSIDTQFQFQRRHWAFHGHGDMIGLPSRRRDRTAGRPTRYVHLSTEEVQLGWDALVAAWGERDMLRSELLESRRIIDRLQWQLKTQPQRLPGGEPCWDCRVCPAEVEVHVRLCDDCFVKLRFSRFLSNSRHALLNRYG